MKWRYDRAQRLLDGEGRTRRWLAKQCAIAESSLRIYMSGHKNPGPSVVKLMSMALGCSEAFLLDETSERLGRPAGQQETY